MARREVSIPEIAKKKILDEKKCEIRIYRLSSLNQCATSLFTVSHLVSDDKHLLETKGHLLLKNLFRKL